MAKEGVLEKMLAPRKRERINIMSFIGTYVFALVLVAAIVGFVVFSNMIGMDTAPTGAVVAESFQEPADDNSTEEMPGWFSAILPEKKNEDNSQETE